MYIYIIILIVVFYRSFAVAVTSDEINPGLVEMGTKCGTDLICVSQSCVNVNTLNPATCPTGTNGMKCSGTSRGVSKPS